MLQKKSLGPILLVLLLILAVGGGIVFYRFTNPQIVPNGRLIDPFGKELPLGFLIVTEDQAFAKVASQTNGVGKDVKGYYLEAVFETSEGVKTHKISLGGDTKDAFTLIFEQDTNLFSPAGRVQYEKTNQDDSVKKLAANKKSISLTLPLKVGGLTNAGFSQAFVEEGVKCNKSLIEDLKQNKLTISCRPIVLQLNIQK
jgi:hypothetical protein